MAPQPADPGASFAVLIGTAAYDTLPGLPAVERNVTDLAALLMDDLYWGLPPERCRQLIDAGQPSDIEVALRDAAAEVGPEGLLLVYFAGHGLVASSGSLHLAVQRTDQSLLNTTSFGYDLLRERVAGSAARQRVVILDCCYAGRALERMTASTEVGIDRAAVLVATNRTATAYAPAAEDHTAFTGELLRTMRSGLADAPDPLDLTSLYQAVRVALVRQGRPEPQLRDHNPGIALIRNAAHRGVAGHTGQVLSTPDGTRFLVLSHRPATGAVAVRLDAGTRRPVRPVLAEWADTVASPRTLFDGGPLAPRDALGVAVLPDDDTVVPPSFTRLAGRVGVLDLAADPGPVRESGLLLRVFVGYHGWGPGQLESELAEGALGVAGLVTPATFGYA
ncbi:YqgE/AlgH family protein [Actinoplanes sp. RD1]|uniref:YqgE/AlgH family protein n=1 Tax=Actinoplanes sp. RD1 TaxID=3064538 RepID=UPI0027407B6D|nr:YqgE/AlgH family protein [Actinoplanes sp. RD1]